MYNLAHGCARVAHCVTARWRNCSHYCRPLHQYDVRFTCSDNREALTAAPTAHSVQKKAFRVHHWASREAKLRHSSGWGTEAFPLSSVICAPVIKCTSPPLLAPRMKILKLKFNPRRGLNPGPAEPEADMLPSEPIIVWYKIHLNFDFPCIFWRTIRADVVNYKWFADHGLNNTSILHTCI